MFPLHRPGKPVFAAALLSAVALLAIGLAPARSEVDAKQIARLIEELGDDELDTRKAAEKKLGDIGEPALAQLRQAAKSHTDPDVRLRAVLLARAIEKGVFGEIRKFTAHTGAIRHIAVSHDGKKALTGSMDYTLRLWDVDTGKELKTMKGHTSWVWQVAFSPDEKFALSSGSLDKTLRLWNLADGKEVRKYEIDAKTLLPGQQIGRFYAAAFSPDGKYVLAGLADGDKSLRMFDRNTGAEVRKFTGHTGWVWKAAFSPDGKKIASAGCNDYSYRIWDVETGKALVVGAKAHSGHYVVGVAFTPDGKQLLTSGRDHTVKLWDVETGKLVKTYPSPDGNVEAVAFSRDGKRFLAGEDKRVYLFDTQTGKILHRFEDHTDYVYAVAFVDDRHALSGGADNTMRLWGLPR